jgi:hypothetical protein
VHETSNVVEIESLATDNGRKQNYIFVCVYFAYTTKLHPSLKFFLSLQTTFNSNSQWIHRKHPTYTTCRSMSRENDVSNMAVWTTIGRTRMLKVLQFIYSPLCLRVKFYRLWLRLLLTLPLYLPNSLIYIFYNAAARSFQAKKLRLRHLVDLKLFIN